jgi:hypothetical protein
MFPKKNTIWYLRLDHYPVAMETMTIVGVHIKKQHARTNCSTQLQHSIAAQSSFVKLFDLI